MGFRLVYIFLLIVFTAFAQAPDHPRQRWEYFYEQRRYPHDKVPQGARLGAIKALGEIERNARAGKAVVRAASTQAAWTFIGPQPIDFGGGYLNSGRVSALAIDPRDNDTVYAGAAEGGIWKTTDGGAAWTPLTDDQPSLAIGALALDPSHPDTIYAGTGEEDFAQDSYSGAGILKSTDAGATWTNVQGPFAQQFIGAIAVHPTDGVTVLAASNIGLYRSTDAGASWALVENGTATAVFFDPAQPGVAWAAMGNPFGSMLNGVYRSADSGATWTAANGNAPNNLPTGLTVGRIQIVNAPASPNTTYAIVANSIIGPGASLRGVYRTIDAGANWTMLNGVPDFCNPQCWFDIVIAPHPQNPSIIFAGGNILNIRSLDGGATWTTQQVTRIGLPHADNHAIAFTNDGTLLYLGNDGGMWSSDQFQSGTMEWNDLNSTLGITEYYPNLSIHPTNPQITLAGSQDNGTHLYGGQLTWPQVLGGDGGWTAIDPSLPTVGYMSLPEIALYRTQQLTDPVDLVPTIFGINPNDRTRFISSYILDPVVPRRMYFGTQYLYQSLDGGGLWQAISPDLTNAPVGTPSSDQIHIISTIAVSPADPNTIYTGAVSGAVYQTTDGGSTWTDRSAGLPTRSVTHIATDGVDPSIVYVTFSGYAIAGEARPGHIFQSSDGGNTWTDISGNLPNIPVDDLIVDPDLAGAFYAATDGGMMVSADGGTTWTTLGTGFPMVAVPGITLHRATRTLRAATHGRGVWDYPLGAAASLQPVIASLSPSTQNAGGAAFVLTITGSNLGSGMHVWWNGQDRQVLSVTAIGSLVQITAQIPASDIQYVGRASVSVFNPSPGAGLSTPASFIVGPAPTLDAGGIVSSANPLGGSKGSPGALITIYGENLAGAPMAPTNYPPGYPLPATFGGVTVIIGNYVAPIYYISSRSLNVQVPYELSTRGTQTVFVLQGTSIVTSTLAMEAVTPALFSMDESGSGQGADRIAGTATIAAPTGAFPGSHPANVGDYLEVYCTGLGAVTPTVGDGAAPLSSPLSWTVFTTTAMVGGFPATVTFSGLTPGIAGLYVVDVQIPAGIATGNAVPVNITIDGVTSNTVTVAVQ